MSNTPLDNWRKQIDTIDDEIVSLFANRMSIVEKIGKYKKENNLPLMDNDRWQLLIEKLLHKAEKLSLPKDLVKDIYAQVLKHAMQIEEKQS